MQTLNRSSHFISIAITTLGSFALFVVPGIARAAAPTGTSAEVNNSTATTVDVVVTGTDFDTFVASGTTTANGVDRSRITYRSTNPTAAVVTSPTKITLTFPISIGTDKAGSLVIQSTTVNDAALFDNFTITIADGTIPDRAAPILLSFTSTTGDGTYGPGSSINVTANYSEPISSGSITVDLNNHPTTLITLSVISGNKISSTYTVGAIGSGQDIPGLNVSVITAHSVQDADVMGSTDQTMPGITLLPARSITIDTSTVAPTVVSATTGDANANGKIDRITVVFSEAVNDPNYDAVAVTGYSMPGTGSGSGTTTLAYDLTEDGDGCSPVQIQITNIGAESGSGMSECVTYSHAVYLQSGANPTPVITGAPGGTFSSTPAGLSINPSTGTIDVASSALGDYVVTYTTDPMTPGVFDTGATPALTWTGANAADLGGSTLDSTGAPASAADGAGPAIVRAKCVAGGPTAEVEVTFSENISDASLAVGDITFSAFADGSSNGVASGLATGVPNDTIVTYAVPSGGTIGGGESTGLVAFSGAGVISDGVNLSTQTDTIPVAPLASALDHFTFDTISSPQTVGIPFDITISARDLSGALVTSFDSGDTVDLTYSALGITPVTSNSFVGGVLTQTVTINSASGPGETISAIQSGGGPGAPSGTSNWFDVNPSADTVSPTGTVALSRAIIKNAALDQVVTITYGESMDPSSHPTIQIVEDAINFSSSVGAWSHTAVDNDTWTQTFTHGAIAERNTGVHVISFGSGATDVAGNPEGASAAGANNPFSVDTTAPTVSIGSPSVSSTSAGPVTYLVLYGDPDGGTDVGAITLSPSTITLIATGTAAGVVSGVTGASLGRTVSISGISGNGTLGISIPSGTSLDLAGNPDVGTVPSTTFSVVNTTSTATLHVIKQVVNDNGGGGTPSLFSLHVKRSGADVTGSPAVGVVSPGRSYTLSPGTYVVSENADTLYVQRYSGDCDASGTITLADGSDKTCTITNDDIAVYYGPIYYGPTYYVPWAVATNACAFQDIASGSEFATVVADLCNQDVVSGVTSTTFEPMRTMNRGEVAKVVVRGKGMIINTTGGPHFSDVPTTNPFYPYIETLYNAGVVSGFGDTAYRPGSNVTRSEFAKMVTRSWMIPVNFTGAPHFADVPSGAPSYQYVETLTNRTIISGYADGYFRPDWPILRQEVAKMTERTMTLATSTSFN